MADNSIIAWTNHTFNPWMGCTKISPGCAHCYAETLTKNRMGLEVWGPNATRQVTSAAYWKKPGQWATDARKAGERRRVFSGSLCDVFEDHPVARATRPRLFSLIEATPELDWLLLTKRPENLAANLPPRWPLRNAWLGTSIESRKYCDRARSLTKVPAVVHFISAEPLLEDIAGELDLTHIEWVIVGGESGQNYRPMDHQWARNLKSACEAAGVAFFFKQSAAIRTEMGTTLDGELIRRYPTPEERI